MTKYATKIVDKIMPNLVRGLSSRISENTVTDDEGNVTPESVTFYREIEMAYNKEKGYKSASDIPNQKQYEKDVKKFLRNKIINAAVGFLSVKASGSASQLVQLAHAQKGHGGLAYCNDLGFPLVDWCAIYAGWLIKNCSSIQLSDIGWSAGVGVWVDNLTAKGLFHTKEEYKPQVGDLIFYGSAASRNHVGIVIEVNGDNIITSEGNTSPGPGSGEWCTRSIVNEHGPMHYKRSDIYGYGQLDFLRSSGGNNSNGSISTKDVDESYRGTKYSLNATQRRIIEQAVSGEFGTDYNGAIVVAQCIRDSLTGGFIKKPEDIALGGRAGGSYDGYFAWGGREPLEIAKRAVKFIFDEGGVAVKHRVLVFYASDYCSSSWHEGRHFICQVGAVRFFDLWPGEHF